MNGRRGRSAMPGASRSRAGLAGPVGVLVGLAVRGPGLAVPMLGLSVPMSESGLPGPVGGWRQEAGEGREGTSGRKSGSNLTAFKPRRGRRISPNAPKSILTHAILCKKMR